MEIVSMIVICCVMAFILGYLFGVERGEKKAIKKAAIPEFDVSNPINHAGYVSISAETEIGIDGTEFHRMMPVTNWEE